MLPLNTVNIFTKIREFVNYLLMTHSNSITDVPRCKTNEDLSRLLNLEDLPFWDIITVLSKTKAIWRKATENKDFKS